jgi:protein TonB
MIKEDEAPPAPSGFGVPGGVPGGIAGGQLGGVLGGIIASTSGARSIVVPPPAPAKRLRISQGVSTGMLIDRVMPEYPKIAKIARVQGTVQLDAWIAKDGSIERLRVISGNPMLIDAAIQAVKQWRYKPYLLSGEPFEVETTVEVNFLLNQE